MREGIDQTGLLPNVVYVTGEDDKGLSAVHPNDVEPGVKYGHDLLIGQAGPIHRIDHGPLVARERDLRDVQAYALADAVRVPRCCSTGPSDDMPYIDQIVLVDSDDEINIEYIPEVSPYLLEIDDRSLTVMVDETYEREPNQTQGQYAAALLAVVRNYGFDRVDVRFLTQDGAPFDFLQTGFSNLDPEGAEALREEMAEVKRGMVHRVEIRIPAEDSDPLGKLIDAGRGLSAFLKARRGGRLTALTIADLLRAGHAKALLGQPESAFLEAKSTRYNLELPGSPGIRQKIELAQDVARFANGDVDAIIVIGIHEGKDSTLERLKPVAMSEINTDQYVKVLDQHIVPAITGLSVETVELEGGDGLVFILVPRQPREMQPYLVHGAIVGDKIEGAFISIVQRRGEGSISLKASEIHGHLVAGRAILRTSGNQP